MCLARSPAAWLLLGLPKEAAIASTAAAMAEGRTGEVAFASR
jgi:hypothetical protein